MATASRTPATRINQDLADYLSRLAPALLLAVILSAAAVLAWVDTGYLEILPDDILSMEGSRQIAGGQWRLIFSPLMDHWLPLYRLVRLPFDLHFPEWYLGFHALIVGGHLASTALLYALARRYLGCPWAALLTALLFAWSRVGKEALLWKVASPYALCWTFLLLATWSMTRKGTGWWVASAAALCAAVGLYWPVVLAVPGLLLGVWLLEPEQRRKAVVVCVTVSGVAAVAWFLLVWPHLDPDRYWKIQGHPVAPPMRLAVAGLDTLRAYSHQLGLGVWSLAVLAALLALRRSVNARWILAVLAMTWPPLFAALAARQDAQVWAISRYGYQSYTLWAVALGALFAALLSRLGAWPRWRAALAAAAVLVAGLYLARQVQAATASRDFWRAHPPTQLSSWTAWDRFFELVSARRVELGRPLQLPSVPLHPYLDVQELFVICHPRGLPGWVVHRGWFGTSKDHQELWEEVERAASSIPGFLPLARGVFSTGLHLHPVSPRNSALPAPLR